MSDSAVGAYAPGNYDCMCVVCKKHFEGDKRSVMCRPCAVEATACNLTPDDLDALAQRHGLRVCRDVGHYRRQA